ncbi:MAG TPA: cysteine desulfurase-like protein [Thermoleophilia bacterium]|nr:cysteine desulfurase-like protein [Thermoleophilia bacterium]
MSSFDVAYVRSQFPALKRTVDGRPAAYLDGPGGTQTPQRVIDAVADYLANHNCNIHGAFVTSEETDAVIQAAREAGADLLGCTRDEVSFGANMTTLAFLLSDAIARDIRPGDEVLITQLDHEANRGPWLRLEEIGAVVREVPVDLETCTLDWEAFERLVEPGKTRVIAVGYASNAVGTVNDVARAAALAREAGALSVIDAVHYALHGPIDVKAVGCDFLLCSAYKFFGPHVGLMYARREAAELLRPVRLCTQEPDPPYAWETGTLNHEGMAGTVAAIDFIADLGERHAALVDDRLPAGLQGRRRAVVAGMLAGETYEQPLARRLREQLAAIPGLSLYGPPEDSPRTSTVSFTLDGFQAAQVCRALGARGLFTWDGDFYAHRLVGLLGLQGRGGLVRVGLAPYTTEGELERLVEAVADLSRSVR